MEKKHEAQLSMTALAALRDRHFANERERALFTALIELAERIERVVQMLERGDRIDRGTDTGRG